MGARSPHVVVVLLDDLDLERLPSYSKHDDGAALQLQKHREGGGCAATFANCTYSAPNIDSVGEHGVRFLGGHVPVSVCTPSRYSVLTGRLPSTSPFYSGTRIGLKTHQVVVSWNTWITQGTAEKQCCGPGVETPCAPARMYGCTRKAKTLGSMLQAVQYFTGFVGKWHLSSTPLELLALHKGTSGMISTARSEADRVAVLNRTLARVRERDFTPLVRSTGFNYTGALSVGNVVDLARLGLAVHNLDWEAAAALEFLSLAAGHVASGRASAFYLHFCTTLTHSPGPSDGVCADPRLCQGGLLPQALPSRESVIQRTRSKCFGQEYDASHTLWVDDAVGAMLTKLRELHVEADTLFIILSDHQRVGKGTLYHGVRTPMLMQWPRRIAAGQQLPRSALVSSLDIVPTVLDAAGVAYAKVLNAGGPLEGKSWLKLLQPTAPKTSAKGAGIEATELSASTRNFSWWRESLWFELGAAAAVKHISGWQLVALHYDEELPLITPAGSGEAVDVVQCSRERLRTGGAAWVIDDEEAFTHTRHCVLRATGEPLTTNLIGEQRVRFDSEPRYPRYHQVEQLLHVEQDYMMQHNWKERCPRQLQCMQWLFREHALRRVRYDGDPIPFGIYTAAEAEWRRFSSLHCDMRVLELPLDRCNEGLLPERSAQTCAQLQAPSSCPSITSWKSPQARPYPHGLTPRPRALAQRNPPRYRSGFPAFAQHLPSPSAQARHGLSSLNRSALLTAGFRFEDEAGVALGSHTEPECGAFESSDCFISRCCKPPLRCFKSLFESAQCMRTCPKDDTWGSCETWQPRSPQGPPPPAFTASSPERLPWLRPIHPSGVCSESFSSGKGHVAGGFEGLKCSGMLQHRDALAYCREQGARLCTAIELSSGVARGSGCGLDGARVWSSTFCAEGDAYRWAVIDAAVMPHGERMTCMPRVLLLPARCCADADMPPEPLPNPPEPSVLPLAPPTPPVVHSIFTPQSVSAALADSPHPPEAPCAQPYGNCYQAQCCIVQSQQCYLRWTGKQFAQCRPECGTLDRTSTWDCTILSPNPQDHLKYSELAPTIAQNGAPWGVPVTEAVPPAHARIPPLNSPGPPSSSRSQKAGAHDVAPHGPPHAPSLISGMMSGPHHVFPISLYLIGIILAVSLIFGLTVRWAAKNGPTSLWRRFATLRRGRKREKYTPMDSIPD